MKKASELTDDELRTLIAEDQGWRIQPRKEGVRGFDVWEPGATLPARLLNNFIVKLPKYPSDLNAMYKVEETLSDIERVNYRAQLYELAPRTVFSRDKDDWTMLHLTARQRAEAFTIIKGLALQ